MSPAKLSDALQADFIRTELETGYRMLELAKEQRTFEEGDVAAESLSQARVALSGAEKHLAAIHLPRDEARQLSRDLRKLRRAIESFENRAPGASLLSLPARRKGARNPRRPDSKGTAEQRRRGPPPFAPDTQEPAAAKKLPSAFAHARGRGPK